MDRNPPSPTSPVDQTPDLPRNLTASGTCADSTSVPLLGQDRRSIPGYVIERELGRGGMGVVYQARQTMLHRTVALKMILVGGHAGAEALERFRTEGEAIARLQHPNIVQIHEVGELDGLPYFSLEFCPGGSLDHKLNGTPLLPQEGARLVATLAYAMQAAHDSGIVHRDLSPGNVLFDTNGTPKISDFGLAKKLDEATQTATGAIMGTPSYMAPEQASGKSKEVGPRSDVYALGAILYECLTGRPPFKAATALDTLLQVIAEEPVPPRILNAQVPRDLETICLKCLRKEPGRRYDSALSLADELGRWQRGEPIRARPVGRLERAVKWVQRNPVVTGAAVAVLAALTLGTTVSTLKYLDAEQQKQEAQKEAAKAERASDYLVSIFELAEASDQRGTKTPRQILDDAEKGIPEKFADQPDLRDKLLKQIGAVYDKMTANAPLAMILEASGTVELQSIRSPNQRPVPQTLLYTGDRLNLGADGQVRLVVLSDLHQEWLRPGAEATVRRKGCEPTAAVHARSNDVMMTFVRLPKGTFYMGWDGTKQGVQTEIKEDFEIAVHAVTQGQWQAVMGDNPSHFSRFGGGRHKVATLSDEEMKLFPVESVSWDDAQAFIKKLNDREKGKGYLYRLPTEAEWEYSCRNGLTSEEECSYRFYFDKPTNDLSSTQANFNGEYPFGKAEKGPHLERTTRVGAYSPNRLGLYDMHGNVQQWCEDSYEKGGSGQVSRGGGWNFRGTDCRAAIRAKYAPTNWRNNNGFRLARVPVRQQDK